MSTKFPKSAGRPVEKISVIAIDISLDASQTNTVLRTTAAAETFTGGHIQGSMVALADSGRGILVLQMVPDGVAIPAVSINNGAQAGAVEKFILWSFIGGGQIDSEAQFNDKIKTMRKMVNGDRLILSAISNATAAVHFLSNFTGFFKQ